MDLICSAVMSLICLQAPIGDTTVVFSNFGLGSSALVQGDGWEATLGLMVDNRQATGELWKACDGGLCVDYRADCEPTVPACAFRVRGGPSGLTTIGIQAQNTQALAAARASLAVIVDRTGLRGLGLDKLPTMDELRDRARRQRETEDEAGPDPREIGARQAGGVNGAR